MKKLHERQTRILELLKENKDNPLSIKDIIQRLDISPGVLYHHLDQLEEKGYLKRNPNNSKDYVVLDKPENTVVYIANYGKARYGPNGQFLTNDPINHIPIASNLIRFNSNEAFIVEAEGDSMIPNIKAGDVVIAMKANNYAENGEIVVCVHQSKTLIKKFTNVNGRITLLSFNRETDPIPVEGNDFFIEGIVKNVISYSFD